MNIKQTDKKEITLQVNLDEYNIIQNIFQMKDTIFFDIYQLKEYNKMNKEFESFHYNGKIEE